MDSRDSEAERLPKTSIQCKEFDEKVEVIAERSSFTISQLTEEKATEEKATEEKATSENSQSNGETATGLQEHESPKYLWKERIQPLYSDLVRILPIEPILDKLLSTDQVKLEEFDKLKQMSGDVERARYILRNVLPYRGNKGFYKFCETLSEAGGYDQILHLIQPERHPDPRRRSSKEILAQLDFKARFRRLSLPEESLQDKRKQQKKIFPVELEKRNFPDACGRDTIIMKLTRYFWKRDQETAENIDISDFRLLCICAEAGAGKSCVAAYYARLHREAYKGGVFFISSRTSASIRHSFNKYMVVPSCEKYDVASKSLEEMNARFLDLVSQREGNVLLIYDSSDDLHVIQDIVPTCSMKVHVLITTRCRDHVLMREGSVIQLPELDEDAAVECFCCWTEKFKNNDKMSKLELDEIRRIVTDGQVKLLPLAIRRVATLTKKTKISYTEMREKLSLKKEAVGYPADELEDTLRGCGLQHLQHKLTSSDISQIDQLLAADVATLAKSCGISRNDEEKLKIMQERLKFDRVTPMHWDLDLDEVARRSQVAEKILSFTSLMDTSAISTYVLRTAVMRDGDSKIGEKEFEVSLHLLSDDFSLLTFHEEEQTCDIHALVQQSVVSHMKRRDKFLPYLICLTKCMQDMLPNSYDCIMSNLNNNKLIALAPHVYSVCDHILKSKCMHQECLQLLKFSCWLATHLHDITTAKHLAEERLQIHRRLGTHSISDAVEMSSSLISVGDSYDLISKSDTAKPYFEEAVQVLQAFGDESSLPAFYSVALNNLALTYQEGGKYDKAIKTYETSLDLQRQCDDGNRVEKSTAYTNLGNCYRESGKLEKSLSLLEEAVTISRSCYSSSHPFLAHAISQLSDTYDLLDRNDEAWKLAREAFDIARVKLPSLHSQLAVYINRLGNCCRSRGNYDEAISWHEKAKQLLQQQDQSPQRDKYVATNLYYLSRDHDMKGCYEQAIELCLEALKMDQESYSPNAVDIAIHEMLLGLYEIKSARLEASMTHLQSSLSVLQDTLPTSHHTADCHFYLATLFLAMKEAFPASLHIEKCLEIRKTIFPAGHSKIEEAECFKQEILKG
ncbi:uncharacterized protein LOC134195518 isoform X2 [Corticium candelabrum]|uniref:uncharacterized protein LOC134195518 isoform X2 n=1 Tax=Corticium candelabrum TaxID=121492 RepID=UPI002E25A346|nr:uncharacterized protein LOC134195518 isoform X2 [Corticium candelabrum]